MSTVKCDCLRSSNHTENDAMTYYTHRYFSKGGGKKVKDTLQKGAPFFSVSLVGANGVQERIVNSQSGASKCWRAREGVTPRVTEMEHAKPRSLSLSPVSPSFSHSLSLATSLPSVPRCLDDPLSPSPKPQLAQTINRILRHANHR